MPLGEIDTEAVRAILASRLSSYKVPRDIIRFADGEVPLLATGKPDRRAVLELVRARLAR
jgi:acyl-CoA synthetase (AMP-forming)/AMP-acid ligase II